MRSRQLSNLVHREGASSFGGLIFGYVIVGPPCFAGRRGVVLSVCAFNRMCSAVSGSHALPRLALLAGPFAVIETHALVSWYHFRTLSWPLWEERPIRCRGRVYRRFPPFLPPLARAFADLGRLSLNHAD